MPTIAYAGADLFYEERGTGDPLVLLHGGDGTHSSWRSQIPAFAKHYRVIAPDSRGYGRSKAVLDLHSWDVEADDLREILDRLDIERAILVAYAPVTRPFLHRYPERVRALVIVGAAHAPEGRSVEAIREALAMIERSRDQGDWVRTERLAWVFTREFVRDHPEEFAFYRRCAAETPVEVYCRRLIGSTVYPPFGELPSPSEWPWPVLFVYGEHDANAAAIATFREALPHARFTVIPGHGHAVYFSAPEAFNEAVLGFLAEALGE
jgi:pimeloyl-ACP methyl ester carboxylesterase